MDYKGQNNGIKILCQITEVVLYTKVLINDVFVRLERILDYADVVLERFNCTLVFSRNKTFTNLLSNGRFAKIYSSKMFEVHIRNYSKTM